MNEMKRPSASAAAALAAILCIAAVVSPAASEETAPATGKILVMVVGLRSDAGKVCATVWDGPDGWPGDPDKALRGACAAIKDGKSALVFKGLPAGEYAVSVLHDEDDDNALTTGFLGIPKEGVGMSLNPKSRFGPPDYADARFRLDPPGKTLRVRVQYLL